jgi:16S rRNA (guanine527-N7)-methyltransferase
VLLDANERRTDFLQTVLDAWERPADASVSRGRAEEIGHQDWARGQFQLVVSRSFGAPAVTAECGSPLLADGGLLVVSEPPGEDADERWPEAGLALLGLHRGDAVRLDDRFGYQTMSRVGALDDRYPRRVGIPAKRPLF